MTKRELLEALAAYDDDQYVYIHLHSDTYPEGCQVLIQGIVLTPPWKGGVPPLIGIVADAANRVRPGAMSSPTAISST